MVSEEWCDRTRPKVYRYIYGLIQDRERAEDLTQETYARVLRASQIGAKSSVPARGCL